MRRLALSARIGRRALPRSACAENSASCARCGEVSRSRCGRLDFKSGRHLASPHQHLQREDSRNTREHPVLVSVCLWTDDVMFIHTHISARAEYWLYRLIRCIFVAATLQNWGLNWVCHAQGARYESVTWHFSLSHHVYRLYDDDDDDDAWSICCRLCVCASSGVRH